ncbi:MAG: putative PEP-binding protein, partial [Actinomycetes bacterium]
MTREFVALGCAPGVALAPAWRPRRTADVAAPVVASATQVVAAFEAVADRLTRLAASYRRDGATTSADIVDAEALIARDPTFADEVVAALAAGDRSATAAVQAVAEQHAAVMEGLASANLRERGADIRQVGRMVADHLAGRVPPRPPDGRLVLLADEVTAPDLLEHADRLDGAVSVRGGANAHASIVARSLGVPLVALVPADAIDVPDGVQVLVDGAAGRVVVSPDRATADLVRPAVATAVAHEGAGRLPRPSRTTDGVDVTLLANVASSLEARRALDAGAVGVGLLRTELPFLDAGDWPTKADHEARLGPVLEVFTGRPVIVRLLDFSNDKLPSFLTGVAADAEPPLLGNPAALDAQLRAALVAGRGCRLSLLLPMVTRPGQLAYVRDRLAAAAAQVGSPVPPLGAMVEVPAAVEGIADLVAAADFVSIGTNDLTAETMGLGRTDQRLRPESAADPRVLRLVGRVVEVAAAAGCPVSV